MTKKTNDEGVVQVEMQKPDDIKDLGGGSLEAWNNRIMTLVLNALPIDRGDKVATGKAGTAVFSGMLDIKSADPIEGMLVSQLVVAHESALKMFQRAWAQPPEYLDARCRYLALADKAQRTVALLTERLDRHRNSGQQQITVKHQHVTVNADQAIVGSVEHHQGGGSQSKSKDQPRAFGYEPGQTLWSEDQERQLVSIASDEKRSVQDARRNVTRRPEGK
jgi:hypothetical protein